VTFRETSTSADADIGNTEGPIGQGAWRPTLAYPVRTSDRLIEMLSRFRRARRAQNVSFRKMVPWLKVGERATHYIHSYPAKLLPQIAHFFLSSPELSSPGDIVLDPFGGTGTVALEAMLAGREAYYADVNPLARLIAEVKTTLVEIERARAELTRVKSRYMSIRGGPRPSVVNIDYWYTSGTIRALCRIQRAVDEIHDVSIRNFFRICFSTTARKVSLADPRLSVPVRLKNNEKRTAESKLVWKEFVEQVETNLRRIDNLKRLNESDTKAHLVGFDARCLNQPTKKICTCSKPLEPECISLIITSPPYAGAQKYIRASSLNLGWLGLADTEDLKPLENASIGREHFLKSAYQECPKTGIPSADRLIKRVFKINPLRSVIIATYLNEMDTAIQEMVRVLKPGGYIVLVVGNNEVCGLPFKSSEYLAEICKKRGLDIQLKLVDEIKSRGLMTKRNKTASIITREWVLLFRKPSARLN